MQSTLKVMSTDGQCLFSWGSELCSTAYLHIIIHPLVIVHHVVYYVQEEYVTTNYLGYLQGELHSFCTYQTACYAHFSVCPASQHSRDAGAGCARRVRRRACGVCAACAPLWRVLRAAMQQMGYDNWYMYTTGYEKQFFWICMYVSSVHQPL